MQAAQAEPSLKPDFAALQGVGQVAIAVSGGSDSMALLRLLLDWAKPRQNPPIISVLTVDHGLRAGSATEAQRVAQWCKGLNLCHLTLTWTGVKPTTGIQAKARASRYELMTNWCIENDVPVLLTAHTADDQNETVTMRQTRTSSARSLAGIWPAREWNGIKIVRPVLDQKREALRNYLKSVGQDWLDDPSNENRNFERVRVRQDNAGSLKDLGAIAMAAQIEVRQAEEFACRWLDAHVTISDLGLLTCAHETLVDLSTLQADAVLLNLLRLTGGRPPPERAHRQNLLEWLAGDMPGRRTLGGAVFSKRKSVLAVAREAGRIGPAEVVILKGTPIIWDGRFRVEGPSGSVVCALGAWGDLPHKELPQFLRLGLPAAMIAGKLAFVPQLLPNRLFNCEFIKDGVRG